MVDFAKMLQNKIARMSPAERAAYEARQAERKALEEQTRPLTARFERSAYRDPRDPRSGSYTVKEWDARIGVRIEPRGDREVIHFVGENTADQSYEFDLDFCRLLLEPDASGRWYLCAGTPQRYDACSVAIADIAAFVEAARPGLLDEARAGRPSPAMGR